MKNKKIIVGVSGGVDSSVAALLLLEQGHEVEALFMKNWDETDESGGCIWEADVEDALAVCEKLGIRLNTVDLSEAYWHKVFREFLEEYSRGRTPNPDILCNQEIKFRAFLDHATSLDAAAIATGHYASILRDNGACRLLKGADRNKDQSYFLCRLNQAQLATSLFPLGALKKPEVRTLAQRHGLITHDKKDSTGICFIGERPFRDFLSHYLPVQAGPIRTLDGKDVGEHAGIHFYTLGQRQGLGIGGVRGRPEQPWYVVAKDVENNVLTVAQGHDHPSLYSSGLVAANMNWIAEAPALPHDCAVKTRYRQADQPCTIEPFDADRVRVQFTRPQRAVTPGQYAVFYDGDQCLGGGVIETSLNANDICG
ncbi:MAG: tRNA 2-thiouridine(34) synthase MnmA [Gammaproteobacteria bacterium]|nr:tRNA 2-thiouridine(34) synthase MnmA [Gammaproteobacteria bacterium]